MLTLIFTQRGVVNEGSGGSPWLLLLLQGPP